LKQKNFANMVNKISGLPMHAAEKVLRPRRRNRQSKRQSVKSYRTGRGKTRRRPGDKNPLA
jgi:hypothetical protein